MAKRDTSRDIDQAASQWTARLDRGPLTAEEEAGLQAWLGGDPRAKGALLRARALSMMSESAQALGERFDPVAFEAIEASPPGRSRRQALLWAGGATAAAALGALGVGVATAGTVVRTRRGEIRLTPLEDGSSVLLNTDSRIRIRYDRGERRVALLEGEAYFSVARDDDRPFVVEVDGRRLTTSQAGFRVRRLERAPVEVLVNQGRVDVAGGGSGLALAANSRMALSGPAAGRPQRLAPETVTRELAWRDGKLAFEGEPLAEAAAAFARYSDTTIEVRDPVLAREPVTGLFAANDPVGFSRAVARVFDARIEVERRGVVLTRDPAS